MKLKGLYRGAMRILNLPVSNAQWQRYQNGEPAHSCFPQFNHDELEFIITSVPVGEENTETPSETPIRKMEVDARGLHINRF